jgi:hypothetical protein
LGALIYFFGIAEVSVFAEKYQHYVAAPPILVGVVVQGHRKRWTGFETAVT